MDYGHRLEFGTFVTPSNADPEVPVALAQLSETLGYDLVTFQDHPYQPSFLDTWTLMSWVAARTERIRIAANVHNVPLRPPAVLARSAASLDLLSGGRVELGIGAGGFWDAIDAMGGTRLTPGESVDALDEAIEVIRAIWDAGTRGGARVDGRHHRLAGAKRGPAPAHDMQIWVGALKPRMLRLIGRTADGWLPSLQYLGGAEALAAGNLVIDRAAEDAGRDPREIRRLLNIGGSFGGTRTGMLQGTPAQWVDDLAPLAIEHGVSTFIVMADDPAVMQRFAEEVAPALRELVDAETEHGAAGTRIRPRRAIELRRAGIDYDAVPASLADSAVEPGDREYALERGGYMRGGSPGIVLRPGTADEVVDALAFARRHDALPLGIRSGGHGISGRSTNAGGIVISLARMRAVEVVDAEAGLVRIEPGARWKDVAAALQPHGLAISSGDYGGVGVGGLATAGGIGFLSRSHGLTIDHVLGVEAVLADGSIVRASADEHPELFWGFRGAGGNLGIVTAFEMQADRVGDVGWAHLVQEVDDLAGFLLDWGATIEASPRDTTSFVIVSGGAAGAVQVHTMTVVDSDDEQTVIERLQPIASLAPLVGQRVRSSRTRR